MKAYTRELYEKFDGDLMAIEGQLHQDYYFEVPEAVQLIGKNIHPIWLNMAILEATQKINLIYNENNCLNSLLY